MCTKKAQCMKRKLYPNKHAFTECMHALGTGYGKMTALHVSEEIEPTRSLVKGRAKACSH